MFGAYAPLPIRLGDYWTPQQHARACADMVAVKRVAPLACWSYTKSGATVTLAGTQTMQGVGPTWVPDSVTVNGTGDVTFAWTGRNYTDAYGVVWPINVQHALPSVRGATSGYATATMQANGVRVYTFSSAGAATDLPVTVRLW